MDNPPLKPFGRSLKNFDELKPAEQKLLEACRKGELANISETRPEKADKNNIVRANFVRFLALGGDEYAPVHENGVRLLGAWVEGELNLESATLPHDLLLGKCHLRNIVMRHSNIRGSIKFVGSQVQGIEADGMRCSAGVFLEYGFTTTGAVSLTNAQIGGNLQCQSAKFKVAGGDALVCDSAVINGSVFLNDGFTAIGVVRFVGTQIGGSLECNNGSFNDTNKGALILNRAEIKGKVFLNDEFVAIGTVNLSGTQINNNLEFEKATLNGSGKSALIAAGMTVAGMFQFHDLRSVKGRVNLTYAKVGRLNDDILAWTDVDELNLNGFIYGGFTGKTPTDAKTRVAWLDKQSKSHAGLDRIGKGFKPQPWQQLQKVLREMGHIEDARQVGIAFEDRLRKANLIGQTDCYHPIAWIYQQICCFFHWCFGWLIGYGYRPLRLLIIMVFVWLACGGFYWYASLYGNQGDGIFAPSNPLVFQKYAVCMPDSKEAMAEKNKPANVAIQGAGNWYLCKDLPEEYTGFSPLAYSLDLILPLVDLQQEHDWSPMIPTPKKPWYRELTAFSLKRWTRFIMWCEILFGWMASLLLVAVVSGLTKRREE
ncbi:MAG: hypothetical protein QX189_01000 [Methylococcales bacterium]